MNARLAGSVALAVLVASATIGCGAPERRDVLVEVREDGVVLGRLDRQGAVADVSRRAGFPVLLPTKLPDNSLRLVSLNAALPVSGIEGQGSDGRSNAVVVATYGRADGKGGGREPVIELREFSRRGEPPAGFDRADSGTKEAELYVKGEGGGSPATLAWLTADRSYTLAATGTNPPSPEELVAMLRSLR